MLSSDRLCPKIGEAEAVVQTILKEFVEHRDFNGKYALIKMHVTYNPSRAFLKRKDIKVVVTYRNLPDAVLSKYYHEVRKESAKEGELENWLRNEGMVWAKNALRYRRSWENFPGALMVDYQNIVDAPDRIVQKIGKFLGCEVDVDRCKSIAERHTVPKKKEAEISNMSHVRTAGTSLAQKEMPADIFLELADMEQSA